MEPKDKKPTQEAAAPLHTVEQSILARLSKLESYLDQEHYPENYQYVEVGVLREGGNMGGKKEGNIKKGFVSRLREDFLKVENHGKLGRLTTIVEGIRNAKNIVDESKRHEELKELGKQLQLLYAND